MRVKDARLIGLFGGLFLGGLRGACINIIILFVELNLRGQPVFHQEAGFDKSTGRATCWDSSRLFPGRTSVLRTPISMSLFFQTGIFQFLMYSCSGKSAFKENRIS